MKKVTITAKPNTPAAPVTADAWVADRGQGGRKPYKRLTIDIPPDLHHRVKVGAAREGVRIVDVVTSFLARRFPQEVASVSPTEPQKHGNEEPWAGGRP